MTAPCRKIIHIDMDAFYAAVEQRDFPNYRGVPLAVGGSSTQRGVIATASYEARAFGVKSAMSTYKALKLCPHLIVVPGRFEAYKAVSQQIRTIFADYTNDIEPLSLDEAYLDVTGESARSPSATLLAYEIKQRIWKETGLRASAGVSYNKFLAKVASDYNKPNGLCVIPPHKAQPFIETLPIGRFYGIGQKTEPKLKALGIHTGADLKALSLAQLEELFGKSAEFYYQLVRGQDNRPVETEWVRKSVGAETTFSQDLRQPEAMLQALNKLAEEVLTWNHRHQNYGRTLTLKVKYADFHQVTRSRTQAQPYQTLEILQKTLGELLPLTKAGPQHPVRLLGVSVSKLSAAEKTLASDTESQQLKLALGA